MANKGLTHASDEECLLLIKLKRQHAKDAMRAIIAEFGLPPHYVPKIPAILEYLTNMVYCLELMLKVLSGDWRTHNVGAMYEAVFGQPHPNTAFMADIATAIRDQKYLFEPNGGLLAEMQALEELYDDLHCRLADRFRKFSVTAEIPAPPSFMPYLRDHADRFYSKKSAPAVMRGQNPADINMVQGMDALMAEYLRDLSAIRLHIDAMIKGGHPLIIRHGQVSIV